MTRVAARRRACAALGIAAVTAIVACGGTPAKSGSGTPAARPAAGTAGVDSAGRAGAGAQQALRDSQRLRDSAFGPKFTMDSTGKIVPIKRP